MTERPYTDDDLRAEAARQHHTLTGDPDFMGVGEQMQDQEVTPGGGVAWDDFSDKTFDAAQSSIHDLITGAADVSEWAVNLGADGLEPDAHTIQLGVQEGEDGEDKPQIRMHFAFAPDLPDADRDRFVMELSKVVARNL